MFKIKSSRTGEDGGLLIFIDAVNLKLFFAYSFPKATLIGERMTRIRAD